MWFVFALITMLAWGASDLFYKKGAKPKDPYSHLKTCIAVGAVMGLHAVGTLLITGMEYDFRNIYVYFPVSLMYILSMTIGYFGLRYLELSLSSPIQNSSGAVTCILCIIFLKEVPGWLTGAALVMMCGGILLLGIIERYNEKRSLLAGEKKYAIGFVAFLMPVLYCVIDALGTFFDAYYLDDYQTTPLLSVTEETLENTANTSYELTFLAISIILYIYLRCVKKEKMRVTDQKDRAVAAVFETAGQAAYVYAMSGNGAVAAPVIASYSIVSLLLSRIFLKERLTKAQYCVVAVVIAGIAVLGFTEA